MSRFGDNATGPSNLEISNIAGVSTEINTLAPHATAISNLGPVSAQISNLGTTAVIADMADLSPQAVRDDMAALANITTEIGLLGTSAMADASTGYITALATSTVGATSQLSIDALGQLATEIGVLGNNLQTLQNSAANSPIQISNLSDVTFANLQNGQALVYNSNSGDWENGSVSAGSVSTSNISEVAAATPTAAGEVIRYDGTSAWTVGQLDYNEILNRPTDLGDLTNNAGYLTSFTETNDLTTNVTWDNVPDANITQSSVTQHVTTLATSANFSDLNEAGTSGTTGDVIHWNGTAWAQGQLAYGEITGKPSVVAALNSTSNTDVLAASQGKALKDLIDGLPDPIVVADNTARDALTDLTVGDIVHVQSDSTVGSNGWRRWQVTAVNTTTNTWANATTIDLASQDDLRGSIIVSGDANNSVATGTDNGAYLDLANQNIVFTTATSTSSMGFVVDEDNMSSNSATKVPTQQSVKAYADTKVATSSIVNNLTSTSTTAPLSAAQGKALQDGKLATTSVVNNLTTNNGSLPLSAAQGRVLQNGKQANITTSTALAAGSLTTRNSNVDTDVRKAQVRTGTGATVNFIPGATLYTKNNGTTTANFYCTNLTSGDIVTVWSAGGQTRIYPGTGNTLRVAGETTNSTYADIGANSIATVTAINDAFMVVSGTDVTAV